MVKIMRALTLNLTVAFDHDVLLYCYLRFIYKQTAKRNLGRSCKFLVFF